MVLFYEAQAVVGIGRLDETVEYIPFFWNEEPVDIGVLLDETVDVFAEFSGDILVVAQQEHPPVAGVEHAITPSLRHVVGSLLRLEGIEADAVRFGNFAGAVFGIKIHHYDFFKICYGAEHGVESRFRVLGNKHNGDVHDFQF